MKKYQIEIEEKIKSTVFVKAHSLDEARDRINTGHYGKQKEYSKSSPRILSAWLCKDEERSAFKDIEQQLSDKGLVVTSKDIDRELI